MSEKPQKDVADVVGAVEMEARRRRSRGLYSADLQRHLGLPFDADEWSSAPEALAEIRSARVLESRGLLSFVSVGIKRSVRRLLAWYVHPITVDQTRFNESIVGLVHRLEQRVASLEAQAPAGSRAAGVAGLRGTPRTSTLQQLIQRATGPVLIIGAGTAIRSSLASAPEDAVVWGNDIEGSLSETAPQSLAGIYVTGDKTGLTAPNLASMPLVASRLRPAGWLATDARGAPGGKRADAAAIDVLYVVAEEPPA